jgi:hypothetical protein
MMPWLPNRESSAKSSPWRTIVVPNASLGRNLSGSSRACETRFLDIDLWYCSAASCSLGDAATSSWQKKDEDRGSWKADRTGAPLQSFFAQFYFLLELLGLSRERRLVFGVDHLIGPLCIVFRAGKNNRGMVSAPDATFQAISASCEIEHKSKDEDRKDDTHPLCGHGVCDMLIIYLFFDDTKGALFARICLTRLHGDLHNTRGARGRCVALIVIISDDEQRDSRT